MLRILESVWAFLLWVIFQRKPSKSQHYHPWVEVLESRRVPSTFRWVGLGNNSDWDNAANWKRIVGDVGTYPSTPNDTADFTAPPVGKQKTATVDLNLTIGSLLLTSKNINIVATGFLTVTDLLTQDAGVIEGSTNLQVKNWDWFGGVVKQVHMTVQNEFKTFPMGDAEDTHGRMLDAAFLILVKASRSTLAGSFEVSHVAKIVNYGKVTLDAGVSIQDPEPIEFLTPRSTFYNDGDIRVVSR
jgi:hypothetical protein